MLSSRLRERGHSRGMSISISRSTYRDASGGTSRGMGMSRDMEMSRDIGISRDRPTHLCQAYAQKFY